MRIAVLFVILILSCSYDRAKYDRDETIEYPDMIQDIYVHYIYKNNKKYLKTEIKRAEFFEKSGKILCEGLQANIFDSKGTLTTEIFADKGNINKNEKLFIFTGNVRVKTMESKSTIFTEELYLDYKNNKMFSNVPVSIKKDDGSYLNASSMESDIKTEEYSFQNMEIKYFYEADDEGKNVKKKK